MQKLFSNRAKIGGIAANGGIAAVRGFQVPTAWQRLLIKGTKFYLTAKLIKERSQIIAEEISDIIPGRYIRPPGLRTMPCYTS